MPVATAEGRILVRVGLIVEAAIIPLAYLLGGLAGIDPGASLHVSLAGLAGGLVATLPLLGLLGGISALRDWPPLGRIVHLVDEVLGPLADSSRRVERIALCGLAGLGEELLFRGFVQAWLGRQLGSAAGLLLGGLIFGMVHALTPLYLVLAGLIGIYLGGVWMVTGNLLTPVVAHALYDLAALAWLLRSRPSGNFD